MTNSLVEENSLILKSLNHVIKVIRDVNSLEILCNINRVYEIVMNFHFSVTHNLQHHEFKEFLLQYPCVCCAIIQIAGKSLSEIFIFINFYWIIINKQDSRVIIALSIGLVSSIVTRPDSVLWGDNWRSDNYLIEHFSCGHRVGG